jgi:HEAT repeat protein
VISVLDMAGSGDPGAGGGGPPRAPSTTEKSQPATDPHVDEVAERRRRVVLAGHRGAVAEIAGYLRDPDAAVRASALGALARAGGLDADVLRDALADPSPAVRRRACEEAGRALARRVVPAEDVVAMVQGALDDPDADVTEAAAWALGEGAGAAVTAVDRLVDLARHGPELCREAAVAALGAIGDRRGLDAVLGALDDRVAVRRRATIALAAFDDPAAEEGLRRAAADRDWQVRQVAEDLLDDS